MKVNFLININIGNSIIIYFFVIMCSLTYIKSTKYKTIIMKINSQNFCYNRDKMNKQLKNFKTEISKIIYNKFRKFTEY
jgi:hypothetical protein